MKKSNSVHEEKETAEVNRAQETKPEAGPPDHEFDALVTQSAQLSTPDPYGPDSDYNPDALRIDQSYLNAPVAIKVLTTIKLGKPGKQDYFRVHPDPLYHMVMAMVELEGDKKWYAIKPAFIPYVARWVKYCDLYLYLTILGEIGFWPISVPQEGSTESKWGQTARAAIKQAMSEWTMIIADKKLNYNSVWSCPEDLGTPVWPDKSMGEFLKITFGPDDRLVNRADHPLIPRLINGR